MTCMDGALTQKRGLPTCHDRLQLPLFFRDVFRLDKTCGGVKPGACVFLMHQSIPAPLPLPPPPLLFLSVAPVAVII